MKQYIVLYPLDDEDIRSFMLRWISEAIKGLSLDEVEKKFYKRFGYLAMSIFEEDEIKKLQDSGFEVKNKYILKDGNVFSS